MPAQMLPRVRSWGDISKGVGLVGVLGPVRAGEFGEGRIGRIGRSGRIRSGPGVAALGAILAEAWDRDGLAKIVFGFVGAVGMGFVPLVALSAEHAGEGRARSFSAVKDRRNDAKRRMLIGAAVCWTSSG